MYTHSRQTRGGGPEKSYAFFSLCDVVAYSKENVVERPLHELPQKVGDYTFSTLVILPLCNFYLLSLSSSFFSLTSLSHPSSPPATTPSVLSAFTQAAQWTALPCRGGGPSCILGSESSCDVLTEVASHKCWHTMPPLHFQTNSVMHYSKHPFFQFLAAKETQLWSIFQILDLFIAGTL